MKSRKLFVPAFLCVLAIYGCGEESAGVTSEPSGDGCVPENCASGKCLETGECAPKSSTNPGNGGETEPCEEGGCETEVKYLEEGESCDPADDTAECEHPLVCENNTCVKKSAPSKENTCSDDNDCAGQSANTTCMPDNVCGRYVGIGESCTSDFGESVRCQEGLECDSFCYELLAAEADCESGDTLHVCDMMNNYFCVEGKCRQYDYNVARGGACNDSYLKCTSGLNCEGGVCTQTVGEGDACNPSDNLICAPSMECIGGVCKAITGSCTKSSDCTEKDSFCCLSASCGAIGKCMPYEGSVTHDEMCRFTTKPGVFEAQVQCRWQPPADDQWPKSKKVEMPPIVGHFGNKKGINTTVAVYSFNARGEESSNADVLSVIRFIDPQTCDTLESIRVNLAHWWNHYPAAADLNDDGYLEFIVVNSGNKAVAYKWNGSAHEVYWTADTASNGPMAVYDVNGDGKPEVIAGTTVLNGQTGKAIFKGEGAGYKTFSLGNFDNDPNGYASQLRNDGIYKWDNAKSKWVQKLKISGKKHTAYADFGTPGATAADFDFTHLDGSPEYVFSGGGVLMVYASHQKSDGTLEAQKVMNVTLLAAADGTAADGGPVTIGDFNNDGLPEIGIASSGYFGVYDPKCKAYEAGKCADKNVLWERWSQDKSSGETGSSLFDFDGDGQTEAVYADECFTRVYDGKTGRVLFSTRRSSATSIEAPVIVDVDDDGSAEILMGSDNAKNCYNDTSSEPLKATASGNNAVDPIHEGIRCTENADCPTNACDTSIGLCTCTSDDQCNTQYIKGTDGKDKILQQYVCADPIHPDVGFMRYDASKNKRVLVQKRGTRPAGASYKVCRATRKYEDIGAADLMILKDRLDRWVSSRNIWNQHAYNIINIEDNGRTPAPKTWLANWAAKLTDKTIDLTGAPRPKYNNFRLNSQGEYGAGMAPDITGRFNPGSICGKTSDGRYVISGKLCNRGTKPVADKLPASFFYLNSDGSRGERICTSYTNSTVGVGECDNVGCAIDETQLKALENRAVLMVTNLDEYGFPSTVECNDSNNTDTITIDKCESTIEIVN